MKDAVSLTGGTEEVRRTRGEVGHKDTGDVHGGGLEMQRGWGGSEGSNFEGVLILGEDPTLG